MQWKDVFAVRTDWRTKLVLLALVHEARNGSLDIARLADKTGLDTDAIQVCIGRLRSAGSLCETGRSYRVDLEALPKQRPFRGRR